jgi:hypothetical protein
MDTQLNTEQIKQYLTAVVHTNVWLHYGRGVSHEEIMCSGKKSVILHYYLSYFRIKEPKYFYIIN